MKKSKSGSRIAMLHQESKLAEYMFPGSLRSPYITDKDGFKHDIEVIQTETLSNNYILVEYILK